MVRFNHRMMDLEDSTSLQQLQAPAILSIVFLSTERYSLGQVDFAEAAGVFFNVFGQTYQRIVKGAESLKQNAGGDVGMHALQKAALQVESYGRPGTIT